MATSATVLMNVLAPTAEFPARILSENYTLGCIGCRLIWPIYSPDSGRVVCRGSASVEPMYTKILIATSVRWIATSRLAIALADAGCAVEAVCPGDHSLRKIGAVERCHPYNALAPLRSLRHAIEHAVPDLVIPGDDRATEHLHLLYRHLLSGQPSGADPAARRTCAVIRRSLGAAADRRSVNARSDLISAALEIGVRAPETAVVATTDELRSWLRDRGFPAVLKVDGTWGGSSVAVVRSLAQAERRFRALAAAPGALRAIKRTIVDRDPHLILPWLQRAAPVVTVQRFVRGRDANAAVACWEGEVLAGINVLVLETTNTAGPATVVELIDHPGMSQAVAQLVRRLGLSGFCGFDFILDEDAGAAHVIEMNLRSTQTGHLVLGPGRDLPGALRARLAQLPPRQELAITDRRVIALFPGAWRKNPASAILQLGYHDVPWGEPGLLSAGFRPPSILSRTIAHWRSKLPPSEPSALPEISAPPANYREESATS